MSEAGARVAAWQLERYLLGELPPEELQRIEAAVAADERLRNELHRLEQSNAEVLSAHPPSIVARRLRGERSERQKGAWGPAGRLALAMALLVAFGAPVLWLRPWSVDPVIEGETRVKGRESQLFLYRRTAAAGVELLAQGSLVRHHDLLQIAYQTAKPRYGVILSIDGRGVVTRHWPLAAGEAAGLRSGVATSLPQAYELDDAPGFERFYLVTSDRPFPTATIEDAARRLGGARSEARLDVPPVMDQFSLTLQRGQ